MPDLVLWATAASLLGVSIVVPAATGGGWVWLLPAVTVPLLVGWVVLQRMIVTPLGELHLQGRRPMIAIVLCTVAAVAVFCGVLALAF